MTIPFSAPGFWLIGLERGALLAGLSLALGGLAGRGLAGQYKGTSPAPLPPPWALRGSLLSLVASAALVVTALADPHLAASLAHPLVLGPRSAATLAFAALEFICLAMAALLLWQRQPGPSVLPLLLTVLAEAFRAHPEGMIPVAGALLSVCHVLPAVVWAGMLVYTVRTAIAWRADPAAVQGLLRLYGNVAAWLLSIVVFTGILSAALLVPIGSLFTTTYGWFLVAKAVLVVVTAGLAVAGRAAVRRRPAPGAGPARATLVELGVLAAVLGVTGVLTVITPPAKSVYSAQGRVTGYHATALGRARALPGEDYPALRA